MKSNHVLKQNIWVNLKNISKNNKKPLLLVGGFVLLENLLLLSYPLFGSFAVNAMLQGQLWSSLSYALLMTVIWLVGSARRAVDTSMFTRLYANWRCRLLSLKSARHGHVHHCRACGIVA